jgi:hypothetical protein
MEDVMKMVNQTQDTRLSNMEAKHDALNETVTAMRTDVAVMKTDISWIKGLQWLVLTASISSVVAAVVNLIWRSSAVAH